ncbi:MAG TPA: cation-translocating P-type ATPase [Bryobacteraceae bacterium]|nr:cation-translocating P-type ATPase [Bryobacteraceae bacterium]
MLQTRDSPQGNSGTFNLTDHVGEHSTHAHEDHTSEGHEHGHIESSDLIRIAVTGLIAILVWFRVWEPLPHISLLGIAGVLYGGFPILREALENIHERRMTMELSMTIALVAALCIGEFFTALIITVFVLAAEVLEGLTVGRGRRAIGDLLDLLPHSAWIAKDGAAIEVPLRELGPGDRVLIRPGTRIPVDGNVVSGSSSVEEATITGEPLPQDKLPGSRVFAGTLNQTGAIEVVVESLGRDTTFGKIVEEVEKAEQTRAPIQRLAGRLAGYLVYFALGSALLTLLFTHNLRSTISVIIVAGACGIAAGTPLAILGAIGRAARDGAIVKGGMYLEQLAKVDTVLLDKTGTLTYGKPRVVAIEPIAGFEERTVLELAAIAERNSEHPLAKAVIAAAQENRVQITEPSYFEYVPGKGVRAGLQGHAILAGNAAWLKEAGIHVPALSEKAGTQILIARDLQLIGRIHIADEVRGEAAEAIRELHRLGISTELLTGDSARSAVEVAESIGVKDILSGLLPEQKSARVDELIRSGRTVAMIGDGINDAPAFSHAHIGVAMGSGTEIAHASANVLLIGNDLRRFVQTVKTARWCRSVIFQNFYGTLIVDALGIFLAAIGMINPLLAAFIHVSSELTFILNSTRLLPRFGQPANRI